MERVAEPAPSLALTTSSPPNWTPVGKSQWVVDGRGVGRTLTVGQGIKLVLGNVDGRLSLAPQGNNGLARVTANNGDGGLAGVGLASDLSDESLGTDNIKSGDTEELLGVELAGGLEDLGGNGDGAVDGVGDDENEGVGAELGNTLDEVANDASVDLEEVVTGHTRLACWSLSDSVEGCVF